MLTLEAMGDAQGHQQLLRSSMSRMCVYSFVLRALTVVLFASMFVLCTLLDRDWLAYFAVLPPVLFWLLDAYYLWQEKLMKKLYERFNAAVAAGTSAGEYSFDLAAVKDKVEPLQRILASRILVLFYGGVLALDTAHAVVRFVT